MVMSGLLFFVSTLAAALRYEWYSLFCLNAALSVFARWNSTPLDMLRASTNNCKVQTQPFDCRYSVAEEGWERVERRRSAAVAGPAAMALAIEQRCALRLEGRPPRAARSCAAVNGFSFAATAMHAQLSMRHALPAVQIVSCQTLG